MRLVAGLTGFARAIPLNGHGQNHRGSLYLLAGCCISGIHLIRIVPTSIEVHDVVVAEVFDQVKRLRILAEEVLTRLSAAIEFAVLQLAVTHLIHDLLQQPTLVAL